MSFAKKKKQQFLYLPINREKLNVVFNLMPFSGGFNTNTKFLFGHGMSMMEFNFKDDKKV